ncbi:MAG: leucine-rich repeat protein [Clostridia bacterium]|nr:leucine-rich repeat protein [Clostridia bacterium]
MKKKLFLALILCALLTCLFVIGVGAEAKIADKTATLSDGTVLDLFDENGDGLIWYIFSTDENGVNTYKSVAVNDNTKDDATSYVTYNVNSTYGTNQMHDIYINYWDAENSKYVSYGEGTIVVANLSTLQREYWSMGTVFGSGVVEYVYHSPTLQDSGSFRGYTKIQLVDMSLSTNFVSFPEQAFRGAKALREVRFGDSEAGYALECKNGNLFEACTSLTTLKFADDSAITSIGASAFKNCTALTGTYTFSGVKSISNEAFRYSATNEGTNLVLSFPSIETLGTSGDTHVFSNSGLKEIYLGKTLTGTKFNTFTKCNKLWKIEIEEGVQNFSFSSYTFEQCTALMAFSVPEGITALPQRMFSGCTSLTAVYLPSTLTKIDTGSQGHSTFFDCHNMYFVSSPFTFDSADDIPEKEDVYYFPSTLTTITGGELFKVCKSLNKTLVFPVGVTSISNAWAFEATINNPTLENIVFLGDMENINTTTWKLTGKIYFANKNDKSASDIATYTNSKSTVFCNAEGNTEHLFLVEVNKLPTCTEEGVTGYKCFCGLASTESTVVPALGHEANELLNKYFATVNGTLDYYSDMITEHSCTRCDAVIEGKEAGTALFTKKGYSYSENDATTFSYTIYVNADAIKSYNEALLYGIVVSANANGAPISYADGKISHDNKTIAIEFQNTDVVYSIITAKLTGVTATTELHLSAYCVDNGAVSYLGHSSVDKIAETISYEVLMGKYPDGKEE